MKKAIHIPAKLVTWLRRIGFWGFLFFLGKGLLWLVLLYWWGKKRSGLFFICYLAMAVAVFAQPSVIPIPCRPHLTDTAVRPDIHALPEVIVHGEKLPATPVDNVIGVAQIPMPVTIVDRKTIERMGSRRLDEVLREQTGLALVSDLGAGNRAVGLQMQGFSSEYITILIDGQPMAGRNSGNFDLSRISVSNIERIEIIKGASSSLYGSEALGGVVNIVTRQHITESRGSIGALYGTNHTFDGTVTGETPYSSGKGTAYLSGDYYRSNGFNVNPYLEKGSQTAPPYTSLDLQGRTSYRLTTISMLHASARVATRHSVMTRDYGAQPSKDGLDEKDVSGMLSLDNRFVRGIRLIARYYLTRYSSAQRTYLLANGHSLQSDTYTEYDHRVELQASRDLLAKKLSLIGGTGGEYQTLRADSAGAGGHQYNYFGFIQGSLTPSTVFGLIAGLRYDGNTLYGGRLNPSLSIRYSPFPWLTFKGSAGKGYKSPSYRELYQVFTNIMQGYTVVGANVFKQGIAQLKEAGLVQQVWPVAGQVTPLKAETSTSCNIGFSAKPGPGLEFNCNAFYNDIRNLINTQQVGIKTNGSQLYSYVNVASAFTKGIEAGLSFQPARGLLITGGYQLLYAKDRAVIDSIAAHSPRYATVRSSPAIRPSREQDYFGLPNRSRHMADLQVWQAIKPWGLDLSARATYRGKYGFLDTDNNGFIDPYDVYVKGYVLVNASLQKKICRERITLQLTLDNIGNHTDYLMPAQPGRMILAGLVWRYSGEHVSSQKK